MVPAPLAGERARPDAMNAVGELLTIDDIRLDLDVSNKSELLDEIAALLALRNGLSGMQILEGLAAREQLGSTGVGHGVAIPHARTDRCAAPAAVFVRTRVAIAFDAPDGKPVSLFLGLIVPNRATERHLLILSTAAAMFCDRTLREKLRAGDNPAAILELLSGWVEAPAPT
jgi:PTS system nitrogen regulatory IIA component